ncbi:MAG TPA: glutathione transferase GstA [Gallionella sp.]|nr:glutathione transferase GstA [Gallionella sp.]
MLKLYYVPGTCALCPHIVLREAGLGYNLEKVGRDDKKTETGLDYIAINPKTNVPALTMDNGQVLTEVAVIVQYLADQTPEKRLAPPAGTLERYRLQEWLNFISSEIHKGCSPLFNPKLDDEAKAALMPRLKQRIAYAADALKSRDYLMGHFTVADAYLFTVLRWAPRLEIDLSAWPVLKDYMERIAARPAVKAAMKEEGL